MGDLVIKWYRVEFWVGPRQKAEKPDDPWTACFQGWALSVDPLRHKDLDVWDAPDDADPYEHVGWKWSVTPKDHFSCPSYSGTVPGVGSVDLAKTAAWMALKMGLAFAL